MGQDLLDRLCRGRIVGTRADGTVDMLLTEGWEEEGATWRYAVCQFCLVREESTYVSCKSWTNISDL